MGQNNFNSPPEIIQANMAGAVGKANLPLGKMILQGIIAGMFIAFGAAGSNVAVHDIANVGLQRALAGTLFSAGLMMIVIVGGELFTGNCMMIMGVWAKKFSVAKMLRNWVVVYISNLVGAVIIAYIVCQSGQLNYTAGKLGAYTINVALKKIALKPSTAIFSGILCNFLVCMAILMATAAKDIIGKIWSIFILIWLFVTSGYEHIVANFYYIPAGIIAAMKPEYVEKAIELYSVTDEQLATLHVANTLPSFLFVTIGNFIGGALLIGGISFLTQVKNWKKF